MGDDGTKYCVVCGQGSNREEWKNSGKGWVACDGHSAEEIKAVLPKVDMTKLNAVPIAAKPVSGK